MRLTSLRIGPRLALAFALVAVLLVVVAGVGLWAAARQGAAGDRLRAGSELTRQAMQVKFRSADFNGWQTAYAFDVVRGAPGATNDATGTRKSFLASSAAFRRELSAVRAHTLGADERSALDRTTKAFDSFMTVDKQVIAGYRSGTTDGVRKANALVMGREIELFEQVAAAVEQLVVATSRDADAAAASASSARSRAERLLIGATIAALLLAAVLAVLITRSIVRPLRQVERAAQGMAEGDLDHQIEVKGRDEIAAMAGAFDRMVVSLRETADVAKHIADGDLTRQVTPRSERDVLGHASATMAESLRSLVRKLSDTAKALSSTSQQMAAASEETGRAVGEIANAVTDVAVGAERQVQTVQSARDLSTDVVATTRESNEHARETAGAAGEARHLAEQGATAVEEATKAISAIREASDQATDAIRGLDTKSDEIGGIVGTITAIAEQTNLLALNASIEAARAGEQGRGFAVVAQEVGKLAVESQAAAASIGELVGAMQTQTSQTVRLVEEGGTRSRDGVATVERAREAFLAISHAVETMIGRIDQITVAIDAIANRSERMATDMESVAAVAEQSSAATEEVSASTEETSASAQEIAASAQELAASAAELEQLVGQFRVS